MKALGIILLRLRRKHCLGVLIGHLCLLPAVVIIGKAFGMVLAGLLEH